MATRLLLTLLALLAGVAAQFTPAQARGSAGVDVEIGALAADRSGQRRVGSSLPMRDRQGYRHRPAAEHSAPIPPRAAWTAAPVLPGIDRARE